MLKKAVFMKQIILYFFLMVCIGSLHAQNVEYGVELDTNYMLIGDQQHLIFKVRSAPGNKIIFPQLKDTVVKGVEIISGPFRDSILEDDGVWLYQEKYLITAFDTGVYVIPPMPIMIEGNEFNNVLRTDQIGFAVNTYEVDPQKGNYDIVLPYATPWTFSEILPYILWVLLGFAVVLIIWILWQRYKKHKPLFTPQKEEIPPYVLALQSLDSIKDEKLWQPGREKEYYTRLTDTVRLYLNGEFGISAMEQTSMEILKAVQECEKVNDGECIKIADMLSIADYVKFAKFIPLQEESVRYLDFAYDFVNTTHLRLQAEKIEQEKKEMELSEVEGNKTTDVAEVNNNSQRN